MLASTWLDLPARPGLIGLHLQQAGNDDTAAEALREAADAAAARLAFDLAADLYRRGLKLTGQRFGDVMRRA